MVSLSLAGIHFGRVGEPLQTADGVMLVASIDDLMATKLKAILDLAEARDYRDIAGMLHKVHPFESMSRAQPHSCRHAADRHNGPKRRACLPFISIVI